MPPPGAENRPPRFLGPAISKLLVHCPAGPLCSVDPPVDDVSLSPAASPPLQQCQATDGPARHAALRCLLLPAGQWSHGFPFLRVVSAVPPCTFHVSPGQQAVDAGKCIY